MRRFASFHVDDRLIGPLVELLGEGAVLRVEKRQAQVRGPAHNGSPPRRSEVNVGTLPNLITMPTANHCIFCR
jgi:hypothetical protein